MANRVGDEDPSELVQKLTKKLGVASRQLESASNPAQQRRARENLVEIEKQLADAYKLEEKQLAKNIKLGNEADQDLRRSKNRLSRANDRAAQRLDKDSKRGGGGPSGPSGGGPSGGGGGPVFSGAGGGRLLRGGKLSRGGRGALGAAAAAGAASGGLVGGLDAIGDTLIAGGLGEAAIAAVTGVGAIPGLVAAGIGGLVKLTAAGLSALGDAAKRQDVVAKELVRYGSLRFRQFGSSRTSMVSGSALLNVRGGRSLSEEYDQELGALAGTFAETVKAGIQYGLEVEEIEALKGKMAEIGALTGESYSEGFMGDDGIAKKLTQMYAEGLGTIDELSDKYMKAVRQYGMSSARALKSIRSISEEARSISLANAIEAGNEASNKNIVLQEDFTAAVEESRAGIDSLVATEEGLTKAMTLGLRLANRTSLTYVQKLKGASDIVKGMTGQFNESYATVTAGKDINYLTKKYQEKLATLKASGAPKEEIEEAQAKMETLTFLRGQNLTPDVLAKMLSEGGFDQDLFASRLKDAVSAGNYQLMQSFQKNPLSLEQLRLMAEIQRKIAAGESADSVIARYMDRLGSVTPDETVAKTVKSEAEREFLARQEEISRRRLGLKDLDDLKTYGRMYGDYKLAEKGGVAAFSAYSDAVNKAADLIKNTLNMSFESLATAMDKATASVNKAYASPSTTVPSAAVPLTSGISTGSASVDARGNILVMMPVPISALQQALATNSARSTSAAVVTP